MAKPNKTPSNKKTSGKKIASNKANNSNNKNTAPLKNSCPGEGKPHKGTALRLAQGVLDEPQRPRVL